jgi:hypothetical protein
MRLRDLPDGSIFFLKEDFYGIYQDREIRRMISRQAISTPIRSLHALFHFVSWLRTVEVGELQPCQDSDMLFEFEPEKVDLVIYAVHFQQVGETLYREVNRFSFSHDGDLRELFNLPDKFDGNLDLLYDSEVVPLGLLGN